MTRDHYLGIDLGGTKILAGVVTRGGKIVSRAQIQTPFESGGRAILEALCRAASQALAVAGLTPRRILAAGMGSPGPLDPETGTILRTPNITLKDLPAGRFLSEEFGFRVFVDNDVHMAVFGELAAGAGRGRKNVIGLWIGTGIGGCFVSEGRVVHGANRNAGEIGHMYLDAKKAVAGEPKGTLEWEASKTGIARRLRSAIRKGRRTILAAELRGASRLDSRRFALACREGDRLALEAMRHSARYLGIAIANLFNAFAPELFILGGGIVEDVGRPYVEAARRAAGAFAFTTELGQVKIAAAKLKGDAGMLGAALAARRKFLVQR
jgi:glucokinase